MIKTILVPVDGSETCQSALAHAIYLANKCNASIHLLHAVNLNSALALTAGQTKGYYPFLKELQDALEEQGKRVLDEAAAKIPPAIHYNLTFEIGVPGQVILDCADKYKADLIIMGSRGLGPIKGLFMGSVSSHVMSQSPRPVLIVK